MLQKKRDRELSRRAAMDAADRVYRLMLLLDEQEELGLIFREAHRTFSTNARAAGTRSHACRSDLLSRPLTSKIVH